MPFAKTLLQIRCRSRLTGTRPQAILGMLPQVRLCGVATNSQRSCLVRVAGRNMTHFTFFRIAKPTVVLFNPGRCVAHPNAKTPGEDAKSNNN